MRRADAGLRWLVLLCTCLGCDPTKGLADAADAALPKTKRYFDPGTRVTSGPWNRVVVDLDADTLYHVGGRRLDDKEPTFHLFGADAQNGCEVTPNAGTWLMGKPDAAPFRVVPYSEDFDSHGRGTVRFTTLDCQVQDMKLENAGRPYPRLYDHGYLVPTGSGYTFADPWQNETHEIATNLQSVLLWKEAVLLWDDGKLKSFSEQFEPGSVWGQDLANVLPFGNDLMGSPHVYLAEDAAGLHRITLDSTSLELKADDVLTGDCHVQWSDLIGIDGKSAWLTAEVPCGNPKPTVLHVDAETFEVLDSLELPFETPAISTRPLVSTDDAAKRTLEGIAYLTDPGSDGRGSIWVWKVGTDAGVKLGEHAELDGLALETETPDWDGSVKVSYQTIGSRSAFDWLRFRWDGSTESIAEHVVRNTSSGEWLANFNGTSGDLPDFDNDPYKVLASGIPAYSGQVTSYTGERHYARIDQFDGTTGRLLLGTEAAKPGSWTGIGENVSPDHFRFSWFMPSLIFMENWNADKNTGTLVSYNYELDARATLAENVSSFDLTSYPWDGIIYAIPSGKKQGIWFAKAK